jgi:hypothetical protein
VFSVAGFPSRGSVWTNPPNPPVFQTDSERTPSIDTGSVTRTATTVLAEAVGGPDFSWEHGALGTRKSEAVERQTEAKADALMADTKLH